MRWLGGWASAVPTGRIAHVHPQGAKLIGVEGKMAIMAAMEVNDKDVQREALLATQHVMVNAFKS